MTISKYFGLLILVLSLVVAGGCKKDKDEPTPVPPENSDENNSSADQSMSADANGYAFSSEEAFARYRTNGQLTIRANDGEGRSFLFVIDSFSGNVTYSFGPGLQNSAFHGYSLSGQYFSFNTSSGGSGSLNITDYNESEQLLSGTFSFTASQVGSPANSIEVSEGEFHEVPITSLQMPEPGEAVFYYNDKYYQADSVEAEMVPPYMLEVRFYHPETGWIRTVRRFFTYPNHEQNRTGSVFGQLLSLYGQCSFNTVYNSENETITQTLELESHDENDFDFQYAINELAVANPYTTESQTVTVWASENGAVPTVTVCSEAYLYPNSDGSYGLSAINEAGDQLNVYIIIENPAPPFFNYHAYANGQGFGDLSGISGYCFWQESELGSEWHSFEFISENDGNKLVVVAKDISIVE